MEDGLARGKGVVLASIHMGNMDMSIQVIRARGVELTILAEVEEPEELFALTRRLRAYNGISILPVTYSGIKDAMKRLRQGEVVAIACDRALQGSGQRREFFGKEHCCPGGIRWRTARSRHSAAFTVRPVQQFLMYFEPPNLRQARREKQGLSWVLTKIVSLMEEYISRHPDQWMVFEPIWHGESSEPRKTASLTSGRRAVNGTGPRMASVNGHRPRSGVPTSSSPPQKH